MNDPDTSYPRLRMPVEPFSLIERGLLVLVVGLGVVCFHAIARWLRWPVEPHFSGSLLASIHPMAGLAVIGVGAVACLPVGSLALGRARYEAGLFMMACGLGTLASLGGTVGNALLTVARPELYTTLLLETVMLLGVIAVAWWALSLFARLRLARRELTGPVNPIDFASALLIQAALTALLVFLLARSDVNKQAMTAVFVAAMLAALATHQTVPVGSSAPFWAGTLLAGMAGFAWAIARPGRWQIGIPANPLANVSPLAYASLGTAGALIGYWASLRWHAAADEESDELLDPSEAPDSHLIDTPPTG